MVSFFVLRYYKFKFLSAVINSSSSNDDDNYNTHTYKKRQQQKQQKQYNAWDNVMTMITEQLYQGKEQPNGYLLFMCWLNSLVANY